MISFENLFFRLSLAPEFLRRLSRRRRQLDQMINSDDSFFQSCAESIKYSLENELFGQTKDDAEAIQSIRERALSADELERFFSEQERNRLVNTVSKNDLWCGFLFNFVRLTKSKSILELGTGIGISAAFLKAAADGGTVTTVEMDRTRAAFAEELLKKFAGDGLEIINSDFETAIPDFIAKQMKFDFIFMDGAHNYKSLEKFHPMIRDIMPPGGILIYDDINYSPGMNRFWDEASAEPGFDSAIDLFQLGLLRKGKSDSRARIIRTVLPTIN